MKDQKILERWKNYKEQAITFIAISAALYVFYLLLEFFWPILVPFIIGILFAYMLKPLMFFFTGRKVPRLLALTLTYIIFLGLLAGIILIFVPLIRLQTEQFIQYLPQIEKSVLNLIDNLREYYRGKNYPDWVVSELNRVASLLTGNISSIFKSISAAGISIVSGLLNLFLGLFISFYILKDWEKITVNIKRLFKHFFGDASIEFLRESSQKISAFVKGQLLVAASVGILAGIVLTVLNVPFSAFLGLLTGIFDLVPYFGPIIVGVLATLIALSVSPELALWTAVAMFAVQQLESVVLAPHIVGKETEIHPVTIMLAFLIGGKLFGILGIILAVPVAGIAKLLVEKAVIKEG
jgi:predicted PurR-regulated permease PerM